MAFPAEGYNWDDPKRYNADLCAQQAAMDWDEARAYFQSAYAKLMAFLEAQSDDVLYGGPMQGAKNAWTPGRWAEAVGASHFRSASKYIRARLRHLKLTAIVRRGTGGCLGAKGVRGVAWARPRSLKPPNRSVAQLQLAPIFSGKGRLKRCPPSRIPFAEPTQAFCGDRKAARLGLGDAG